MKKFWITITSLVMAFCLAFSVTACNKTDAPETPTGHTHNYVDGYCTICGEADPDYNSGGDGGGDIGGDDEFSYYSATHLRSDKKIYALNYNEKLSNDRLNTAAAIQGLFARDAVTFYIDGIYVTNGTNADRYYLDAAAEYGVTYEETTLEEAVRMYIDSWDEMVEAGVWGSSIDLATGFKDSTGLYSAYSEINGDGYASAGYIVYDTDTYSVNIASTLAGITGFIPVCIEDAAYFDSLGLTEKMDVSSSLYDYNWCFNAVMSELSPEGLVHQNYDLNGKTNFYVRDYGVTYKYFYTYYDSTVTASNAFRTNLHRFLSKNIPIIGYAYNETADVALFSQYGQFLVPTDYTMNLTFHVAAEFRSNGGFTQPNTDKNEPAEQGKHYVAFVVSDGDNAQYWQNTAIFSTSYMNATGRDKDDFAVTWSITPSLADMMPLVMNAAYNGSITTENDYFCAPVSGQGYIDAGNFYNAGSEYMSDFLSKLDVYLDRADLSVATIIGAENYSGGIYATLDAYASVDSLKGGLVLNGDRYFGGNYSGGVYWKNGKPFIVPRDSLWSTTPAYIAARINKYAATETGHDVTDTDAYTVINVHPWSHNYADIRTVVNMLSDNVEVVSLDRLVTMMTDNVTDKSDTVNSFVMPKSGSGWTISDSDLQADPSSIPVNPLYNDFLLWEEDWTGDVTYCSSDAATSDVYPAFKTNIQISGNGTAQKAAFTLPDVENEWITFYARANSETPSQGAEFRMKMTVGGVEKTVIAKAQLKGVSGTNTATVSGDGWQAFTFPIAQYFPDYRGKTCTVTIETLTSISIKMDRFTVTDRAVVESSTTVCDNPYSNEFENASTEDWLLGDVFETSQYHSWAAVNRETLLAAGKLEVDASDGGGTEKRNGNTNVWFAKTINLAQTSTLTLKVSGNAKSKLSLYIDGQLVVLYDWVKSGNVGAQSYNLAEICAEYGIDDISGKDVTFVFEVRDDGISNGDGQDYYLDYFRLN